MRKFLDVDISILLWLKNFSLVLFDIELEQGNSGHQKACALEESGLGFSACNATATDGSFDDGVIRVTANIFLDGREREGGAGDGDRCAVEVDDQAQHSDNQGDDVGKDSGLDVDGGFLNCVLGGLFGRVAYNCCAVGAEGLTFGDGCAAFGAEFWFHGKNLLWFLLNFDGSLSLHY